MSNRIEAAPSGNSHAEAPARPKKARKPAAPKPRPAPQPQPRPATIPLPPRPDRKPAALTVANALTAARINDAPVLKVVLAVVAGCTTPILALCMSTLTGTVARQQGTAAWFALLPGLVLACMLIVSAPHVYEAKRTLGWQGWQSWAFAVGLDFAPGGHPRQRGVLGGPEQLRQPPPCRLEPGHGPAAVTPGTNSTSPGCLSWQPGLCHFRPLAVLGGTHG